MIIFTFQSNFSRRHAVTVIDWSLKVCNHNYYYLIIKLTKPEWGIEICLIWMTPDSRHLVNSFTLVKFVVLTLGLEACCALPSILFALPCLSNHQ